MGDTDTTQPPGDKIRKAVRWISEMVREHPEKSRVKIVKEAGVRFDLTPRECDFLEQDINND